MGDAIAGVLPSAVAVALSPIPIIGVVLMLSTPKARTNGPAFALGWVLGLAVVSTLVVTLVGAAPTSAAQDGTQWVKVALGVMLLGLAVRAWQRRPAEGAEPEMPAWMRTIDAFSAPKSFATGVALSAVNPKNLALTLAAAASIAQADLPNDETTLAVVVFVAVASVTVAGAVLWSLVAGEAARRPLDSVKAFMTAHNSAIMSVILLIFGVKLVADGFGGL